MVRTHQEHIFHTIPCSSAPTDDANGPIEPRPVSCSFHATLVSLFTNQPCVNSLPPSPQIPHLSVSLCQVPALVIDHLRSSGFTILVLPLSVVRFITFKGNRVGSAGTIFGGTWFALTGLVEVVLFLIFRPDFGLRMPVILDNDEEPVEDPHPLE